MSTNHSISPTEHPSLESASLQGADAYAAIIQLARESTSQPQFLAGALRCIAQHFASPYAAVYVRYASEVVHEDVHRGATDPGFWKSSLQEFLTESLTEPKPRARLLRSRTGRAKTAFLSAPVWDPSGPALGALALVVSPIEDHELADRLVALEALSRLASFAAEFLGNEERETAASATSALNTPPVRRALARAAGCSTVEELAFAITNELCNMFGCEQVALGLVSHGAVRVISISGLDAAHGQTPDVSGIRAAMEECLDAGTVISCQSNGTSPSDHGKQGYRLHRQWHALARGDGVASIPLSTGKDTVAVLGLRRRPGRPFPREELEDIRQQTQSLEPVLLLLQRATRSVVRHGLDNIREFIIGLMQPGGVGRKVCEPEGPVEIPIER